MSGVEGGWRRLPPHAPGMRIGLYGGTFDPPHPGHRLVAQTAMKRLGLHRVWWLVTPGNPLKARAGQAPWAERVAATRALARHPRHVVADLEGTGATAYTVDTLRFLTARAPGVRFVWIMGADGLAHFHRWRAWREIAALAPLAVVERPGWTEKAVASKAAVALRRFQVPDAAADRLASRRPPAWALLRGRRCGLSSTAIRARRRADGRGR